MNEIQQLAQAIAKQMPAPIPVEVDLWDAQTCAALFKRTVADFNRYIKTHPKFPKPVVIPLTRPSRGAKPKPFTNMEPLWKAVEVIDYADKCQER